MYIDGVRFKGICGDRKPCVSQKNIICDNNVCVCKPGYYPYKDKFQEITCSEIVTTLPSTLASRSPNTLTSEAPNKLTTEAPKPKKPWATTTVGIVVITVIAVLGLIGIAIGCFCVILLVKQITD